MGGDLLDGSGLASEVNLSAQSTGPNGETPPLRASRSDHETQARGHVEGAVEEMDLGEARRIWRPALGGLCRAICRSSGSADDPEGDCAVEELLVNILPLGLFAFGADNAWLGERNGAVVYINRTVETFDMDRAARAGVYRAKQCEVTEDEQVALLRVAGEVAQQFIPVEFLVAVGVY